MLGLGGEGGRGEVEGKRRGEGRSVCGRRGRR